MPSWDENSAELKSNIEAALEFARLSAESCEKPNLEMMKLWQGLIMQGLTPQGIADKSWYGKYRGEEGQEYIGVAIGDFEGTPPDLVEKELDDFLDRFRKLVAGLDRKVLTTDKDGK